MPLNDMIMFEYCSRSPFLNVSGIEKWEKSDTWETAVALFWSFSPPRLIIAHAGGEAFYVVHGKKLLLVNRGFENIHQEKSNAFPDCASESCFTKQQRYIHGSGLCVQAVANAKGIENDEYMGCFTLDESNNGLQKVESKDNTSWKTCRATAQHTSSRYFALSGDQCYIGNDVATAQKNGRMGNSCVMNSDGHLVGKYQASFSLYQNIENPSCYFNFTRKK